MDKTEVKKKINKIADKYIKSRYTQQRLYKLIDEYTQQISREAATEYTQHLKPHIGLHWIKINFDKWFNKWKSNQEESK